MLNLKLPKKIADDFLAFCELNKIDNPEKEALKFFMVGFNMTKFGNGPFGPINTAPNIQEEKKPTKTVTKKTPKVSVTPIEEKNVETEVAEVVQPQPPKKKVRIIKT